MYPPSLSTCMRMKIKRLQGFCFRRGRVKIVFTYFAVVLCLAIIITYTESSWLPLLPWIFPAPRWVPESLSPLIGVPFTPRRDWYSQFGQDRWVVSGYCRGERASGNNYSCTVKRDKTPAKTHGHFVELGAHDGVKNSNTKALEDRLSWQGICIEPDPLNFRLLSYRRPKCIRKNVLVGSVSGAQESFVSGGVYGGIFGGMGGATGIKRLRSSPPRSSSTAVSVQTVSLTSVLEEVKAPKFIDYLSLDVEGNEVGVLVGLDFSKYKFGRITVEHNFNADARLNVFELLTEQGYIRVEAGSPDKCAISNRPGNEGMCAENEQKFCSCVDDFYVHGSLLQN